MKKMFFLLSVAFLLVAATPAWPANNNCSIPEQKWPETVHAWPSPSGYPSPANTGYPYPVSKVA